MRLQNDTPLFAWWFVTLWWVGVLTFTVVALGAWPPAGQPVIFCVLILGFLWASGALCMRWALRQRRVRLEVRPDGMVWLEEFGPFLYRSESLYPSDIQAVTVVTSIDSDGDPYFECRLVLRDGRPVIVAESYRRGTVEGKASRLREALLAG
jgi:hypothetical protein